MIVLELLHLKMEVTVSEPCDVIGVEFSVIKRKKRVGIGERIHIYNVGLSSMTSAQHQPNIGSTSRVCWDMTFVSNRAIHNTVWRAQFAEPALF